MTKNIPEYIIKVTLDTSLAQDKDPVSKMPLGTYRGVLADLDKNLKQMEKGIKSASNFFEFFNTNLKSIDKGSGLAHQSFFVRESELKNVLGGIDRVNSRLGDSQFRVSTEAYESYTTSRKVLGTRAQKKAIEEIGRIGGSASVNPKNADKVDFTVFVPRGETSENKSATVTGAITQARKYSRIEGRKRKQAEKEYVENEVKKYFEEEKQSQKREEEKKAKDLAKQEKEDKKKEKEWIAVEERSKRQKEREERRKEKEEAKQKRAQQRKMLRIAQATLTVITVIGDVVRRILTATLKQATENNKNAVEARSVGVTALARRGYDIFDIAHGMEKGTTFGGIQSIQNMFGNVTNLDQKALGTLARVMGNSVGDMVRSGMGGSNPELLYNNILDAYFKQLRSGKNSLGQSVGIEQAKRELITSLQTVSPEIAKAFARMADDWTSGAYGDFKDVAGWRGTTNVNRSGLTSIDQNFSTEMGKKYNDILAIVEDLKTSFFTRLGNSMNDLLTKVKNTKIGMSATNKIQTDAENKLANEQAVEVMQRQLSVYNASSQGRIDFLSSRSQTPTRINKTKADKFKFTAELLAGIAQGYYGKDYLLRHMKGTGMDSAKDISEYMQRAREIYYDSAIYDPAVQDEIFHAEAIFKHMQKIDKTNSYEVGSGKIENLALSDTALDYEAQSILEDRLANSKSRSTPVLTQLKKEGFKKYLKNNPEAYSKLLSQYKKAKGTDYKKFSSLSAEEQLEILADYGAGAFALSASAKGTFAGAKLSDMKALPFDIDTAYNYIQSSVVDQAKERLSSADSTILGRVAREYSFDPRYSYNVSSTQGTSGEAHVVIDIMNGNKIVGHDTLTLSNTKTDNAKWNVTFNDDKMDIKEVK